VLFRSARTDLCKTNIHASELKYLIRIDTPALFPKYVTMNKTVKAWQARELVDIKYR
jgi:hypothetical protein